MKNTVMTAKVCLVGVVALGAWFVVCEAEEDVMKGGRALTGGPLKLVVTKSFPEIVGGQQGIATDGKYVYMQATARLVKYDLQGNVVAKTGELKWHHGGIAYHEGKIYAAVSACEEEVTDVHRVYVYDAETLEKVEAYDIHEHFGVCAGGIAYHDHHFYVAESYYDNEHSDYIVKFDEDFQFVESYTLDFKCPYGIQGLHYLPELGKFMVNSHGTAFYLVGSGFDSTSIDVGESDFELQDVAHVAGDTVLVNDRDGGRVCFAQLERGMSGRRGATWNRKR